MQQNPTILEFFGLGKGGSFNENYFLIIKFYVLYAIHQLCSMHVFTAQCSVLRVVFDCFIQ